PADTCVLTDNRMAAAFTHTNRVSVPGFTQHRQDFVVLDWAPLQTAPLPGGLDTAAVSRQIVADGFHQVARFGDVAIWQAPDYAGPDASACGPAAS
ncbi:MAG: hypothetical protein FWF75_02635, partial [Propionibacteriaceae bacterium]|nr:hypothetical protein [Propionibacteriaceae bacterium]